MRDLTLAILSAALLAAPAWGHKAGPDPGHTNAPGENNCTSCHLGTLNSGGGNVKVEIVGAATYGAGVKQTLRVTLTDSTATRWGFQLSARLKDTSDKAGAFSLKDPTNTRMETVPSGLEYVSHTEAGTKAGSASPAIWEVEWTGPPVGAGAVVFYVAGNAANRNGDITGDKIYAASAEYAADGGAGETKSYTLPQVAFGVSSSGSTVEEWTTELYFTNTGGSMAAFTVDFHGNNGSPMAAPVSGGGTATSMPVMISQGATSLIRLASSSPLAQGWASVKLPAGVRGLGIFRQRINNQGGSEAMVPLSDDSRQNYVMIWDDAGFTTVMAVVNPGDSPVTVSFTVRGAGGSQIGTGTVNLGPKEKKAFVIREELGLAMLGQRGAMDISVASGKLSVLGLKFGEAAFTSNPPFEK